MGPGMFETIFEATLDEPLTEEELHDGAYMEGFSDAARDYDKIVDRVFAYCIDDNDCDELKVQKILQDMVILMSFR